MDKLLDNHDALRYICLSSIMMAQCFGRLESSNLYSDCYCQMLNIGRLAAFSRNLPELYSIHLARQHMLTTVSEWMA